MMSSTPLPPSLCRFFDTAVRMRSCVVGVLLSLLKGLPSDVTTEEVREHFTKCGIIATDPITQQPKIKLYK